MGNGRFLPVCTMFMTVMAVGSAACPQVCNCPTPYRAECYNAALTHVPKGLPSAVRFLNASGNSFQALESGAFSVSLIKILDLSNNRISTIEKEAFTDLEDVIYLYLSRNEIVQLDEDVFKKNNRLEFLKLDNNIIDFPVGRPFLDIPSLRSLDMSSCKIRYLPEKTFVRVPSLEELRLSHNLLPTIEPRSFLPLESLKSLYLSDNLLKAVQEDLFVVFKELVILDLSNNKLQSIHPRAFMFLESVEILELSGNRLTILEAGVLTSLISLKRLHLQKNLLNTLDGGQFSDLNNLKTLDLSGNCLSNVQLHFVCHASNLTYLKVSENHLTCNCEMWELWEWSVQKGVRILSTCEEFDFEFSENIFESFKINKSCNKKFCDEEYMAQFPVQMYFPVYMYVIIVAGILAAFGIATGVVFRHRKEFCKRRNIQVHVTRENTATSVSHGHEEHTARLQRRQELQKGLHHQYHQTSLKIRAQRARSASLKTLDATERRIVRHSCHECGLPAVADNEVGLSNADALRDKNSTSVFLTGDAAHPTKQERLKASKYRSVSEPRIRYSVQNAADNEANSHIHLNPLSVSSLQYHTPTEALQTECVYGISYSGFETAIADKL